MSPPASAGRVQICFSWFQVPCHICSRLTLLTTAQEYFSYMPNSTLSLVTSNRSPNVKQRNIPTGPQFQSWNSTNVSCPIPCLLSQACTPGAAFTSAEEHERFRIHKVFHACCEIGGASSCEWFNRWGDSARLCVGFIQWSIHFRPFGLAFGFHKCSWPFLGQSGTILRLISN